MIIGERSLLRPANYFEQQVPDIVNFARQHGTRVVEPEFQIELEQMIPSEGISYQVLNPSSELVYGNEPTPLITSAADMAYKLNTSETIGGRIISYFPVLDENGNLSATLVLAYRLTLLSSNPKHMAFVLAFGAGNVLAPFFFILIFTVSFARRLGRRLEGPINQLIAGAERIKQRDLNFTFDQTGGSKELADLASAFEDMRSALQEALTAQWQLEQERRDMIANIVHDVQTPLTVITGHIDNLLTQKDKQAERLEQYLMTIRHHAERVSRLVRDMRALADVERPELKLTLALST